MPRYEVGLSGGSRLHDLFVSHEAMTPGDYKRRGEGLEMAYGFHASPVRRGVADRHRSRRRRASPSSTRTRARRAQDALADMMQRWPKARYVEAPREDRAACPADLRLGMEAATSPCGSS